MAMFVGLSVLLGFVSDGTGQDGRMVEVGRTLALRQALSEARAGDRIRLAT